MPLLVTDLARSTLAAGISGGATSFTVATGQGALFPAPSNTREVFYVRLGTDFSCEYVRCTARSGDVFTCDATTGAWSSATAVILTNCAAFYAALQANAREKLSADLNLYVDGVSGSDSNAGLASGASAFQTIQKAVNVLAEKYDLGGYNATIHVADATYTGNVVLKDYVGPGMATIDGNSGTPANVFVNVAAGAAFSADGILRPWTIQNLKIAAATYGIQASRGAKIYYSGINFSTCTTAHLYADFGGYLKCTGNYTVSGAAAFHWRVTDFAVAECQSKTITFTTNPTALPMIWVSASNVQARSITFTNGGYITGKRYAVDLNGIIDTNGGGSNYFPGSIAGTAITGGQYA